MKSGSLHLFLCPPLGSAVFPTPFFHLPLVQSEVFPGGQPHSLLTPPSTSGPPLLLTPQCGPDSLGHCLSRRRELAPTEATGLGSALEVGNQVLDWCFSQRLPSSSGVGQGEACDHFTSAAADIRQMGATALWILGFCMNRLSGPKIPVVMYLFCFQTYSFREERFSRMCFSFLPHPIHFY